MSSLAVAVPARDGQPHAATAQCIHTDVPLPRFVERRRCADPPLDDGADTSQHFLRLNRRGFPRHLLHAYTLRRDRRRFQTMPTPTSAAVPATAIPTFAPVESVGGGSSGAGGDFDKRLTNAVMSFCRMDPVTDGFGSGVLDGVSVGGGVAVSPGETTL